jgi:hypothetical protein
LVPVSLWHVIKSNTSSEICGAVWPTNTSAVGGSKQQMSANSALGSGRCTQNPTVPSQLSSGIEIGRQFEENLRGTRLVALQCTVFSTPRVYGDYLDLDLPEFTMALFILDLRNIMFPNHL